MPNPSETNSARTDAIAEMLTYRERWLSMSPARKWSEHIEYCWRCRGENTCEIARELFRAAFMTGGAADAD